MAKPGYSLIEKPKNRRVLGLGAEPPSDPSDFIAAIKGATECPIYNMEVPEQVRWTLSGPQTALSMTENFGAEIDLFGSGKSPTGIDFVETTMAQPGQTQTYFIACAIGFHVEPEPLCFTAQGNAWTHPAGTTAAGAIPISPNVFTQNDRANGALRAFGAETFLPAIYEHGWWANYAAWNLVRGYNLRWKIGTHVNIMDEVLRHTAYMPPNSQDGSASSSQVDICDFVRQLNDRYDSLGSTMNFLKINRVRVGDLTVGGVDVGDFRPSRDFEMVGVTYGGMDLRNLLRGNSEFRRLSVPYLIKPGVPIGLILQQNDSVQVARFQRYLSIMQGQTGTIPPSVTDDANIAAIIDGTGVTPVGAEQNLDTPPVNRFQQMDSQRVIFKGGELKLSLIVRGFEVTENWAQALTSNRTLMSAVWEKTGLSYASQGAV